MFEDEIPKLLEIEDLQKLKANLLEIYSSVQKDKMKTKIKKSGIPEVKLLEQFNFAFLPALKPKILDLAKGSYIKNAENGLLLGPTGTGKTHLVSALGIEALKQNKSVKFINASEFFLNLEKIQNTMTKKAASVYIDKLVKNLVKVDLLIFDDIGIKKIDGNNGEILHQIITKRHGKKSTLFTSNIGPQNWMSDKTIAFPILDRIYERVHKLEFIGESYRTRGK